MKRFLIVLMVATVLVAACDETDSPLTDRSKNLTGPTKDDTVAANVQLVVDALALFAAENAGEYPSWTHRESLAGSLLVDFLPGGEKLINPYTGEASEPRDCDDTPASGRIIYEVMIDYVYFPYTVQGYRVAGYGELDTVAVATAGPGNLLERDARVIQNCDAVRDAVEAFAANNGGVYPDDLSDTDFDGDTVIDLLPGGMLLTNPYHFGATEPQDGAADEVGETGYVVNTDIRGVNVGYVITGWGWCGEIFEISKTGGGPPASQ